MAVGEIRIDFRAMVARFQRDINKANRSLDQFGRRADRAGRLLQNFMGGLAVGVTAGGFTAMIRQSIQFADSIDKAADRLNIGVQRFQEYQFAATQASVTQTQLMTGLRALTRRVGEAERGSKNYLEALQILGIEMRDIRDIEMEDTFDLVIRRLGEMEDRTDAMVAATRLFDVETGAAMLNVAKGYDNAIKRFREAGVAIDENIIRNAAKASSELDFLNSVMRSKLVVAFRDVYDWIIQNTKGFIDWIDQVIRIKTELDAFARILNRIASGELNLTPEEAAERRWLELRRGIEQTEQQLIEFLNIRDRLIVQAEKLAQQEPTAENIAALRRLGDQYAGVTENIEAATKRLEEFKTASQELGRLELPEYEGPQFQAPNIEAVEAAARNIIRSQFEYVKRITEEQKAHAEKMLKDLIASEDALLREHMRNMMEAEERALQATLLPGRRFPDLSEETMAEEGRQLFEATRTEMERLNMEFERLDQLLAAGAISFDTYARAIFDADKQAEELEKQFVDVDKVARDMGNTFTSAFEDAVIEGQDLRDVLKGLFDDIQRILLRTTVTAPLQSALGGFFAGIFGGGGGGGAKAAQHGGPVRAGMPYIVGEKGPELFIPERAGEIKPNVRAALKRARTQLLEKVSAAVIGPFENLQGRAFGGMVAAGSGYIVGERGPEVFVPPTSGRIEPGVGGNTYNIDARGAEAGVEQRIVRAIQMAEDRAVNRSVVAIQDMSRRGGSFTRTF